MFTLNGFTLENNLRVINEKSADIFQWTIDEFDATQAWVELTKEEFIIQAGNPTLWSKVGENQFGGRRYKWDEKRFYVQLYRNDNAPIKGWMRRVMQKVHALKKYNQRDIERIAKAIRLSVEQV